MYTLCPFDEKSPDRGVSYSLDTRWMTSKLLPFNQVDSETWLNGSPLGLREAQMFL